jgi:hypothetical protein
MGTFKRALGEPAQDGVGGGGPRPGQPTCKGGQILSPSRAATAMQEPTSSVSPSHRASTSDSLGVWQCLPEGWLSASRLLCEVENLLHL